MKNKPIFFSLIILAACSSNQSNDKLGIVTQDLSTVLVGESNTSTNQSTGTFNWVWRSIL
jgi:hypothetical protein